MKNVYISLENIDFVTACETTSTSNMNSDYGNTRNRDMIQNSFAT